MGEAEKTFNPRGRPDGSCVTGYKHRFSLYRTGLVFNPLKKNSATSSWIPDQVENDDKRNDFSSPHARKCGYPGKSSAFQRTLGKDDGGHLLDERERIP